MLAIVGGVFLVLLLGLGIGWFVFRRMLLPQSDAKLPPSGAHPWSRTRVPYPDNAGGVAGMQMALANANGGSISNGFAPGSSAFAQANNGFGPQGNPHTQGLASSPNSPSMQGFAPAPDGYGPPNNPGMQGFAPSPNGFGPPNDPGTHGFVPVNTPPPAGFGPPVMHGGSFSDGFIPPSPQIFPQGDSSMIPPGSGAFPAITSANGFAPASQAFNAMYGLPDDPFASSQAGSPGWMANLNSNRSLAGSPPSTGVNFSTGEPDLNDPYLAEVIRQYSQKGQSVRPPQPQQAPQIPQREPRNGYQDSGWLQ